MGMNIFDRQITLILKTWMLRTFWWIPLLVKPPFGGPGLSGLGHDEICPELSKPHCITLKIQIYPKKGIFPYNPMTGRWDFSTNPTIFWGGAWILRVIYKKMLVLHNASVTQNYISLRTYLGIQKSTKLNKSSPISWPKLMCGFGSGL